MTVYKLLKNNGLVLSKELNNQESKKEIQEFFNQNKEKITKEIKEKMVLTTDE